MNEKKWKFWNSLDLGPSRPASKKTFSEQHICVRGLKGLENHGRYVLPTVLVKPQASLWQFGLGSILYVKIEGPPKWTVNTVNRVNTTK